MDDQVHIIWTSPDKGIAKNFAFMYALNSKLKQWWQEVHLIVWGPSAQLLAEDAELQASIAVLLESGVHVSACRRCAENYGVVGQLEALGLEVIYMGEPLTKILRSGERVITA